jgi:hypothetical protein
MTESFWRQEPAFTGAMEEELRIGKYTRRFCRLSKDQLAGLLWLLGEYLVRAEPLDRTSKLAGGDRRRVVAHNALRNVYYGEAPTLEEVKALIRASLV